LNIKWRSTIIRYF